MINLLSPEEKTELSMERKRKIAAILGSLFLIFLIFLVILLFSVKIYILSQIQSQKTTFDLENKLINSLQVKEFEENITNINNKISQLNDFYKNQVNLSQVLDKISNIAPVGIYLTDFSYQKEKSQITILGQAKTRDNLLEFKKSLESQSEIKNLYSPISNLTKPTNIDFYFTFNISQ